MLATTAAWCTKVLLRVGFEVITSPMDEVNSNSKTGFRSIYFVVKQPRLSSFNTSKGKKM
jgi:very-short-patch-repair endonuclease